MKKYISIKNFEKKEVLKTENPSYPNCKPHRIKDFIERFNIGDGSIVTDNFEEIMKRFCNYTDKEGRFPYPPHNDNWYYLFVCSNKPEKQILVQYTYDKLEVNKLDEWAKKYDAECICKGTIPFNWIGLDNKQMIIYIKKTIAEN